VVAFTTGRARRSLLEGDQTAITALRGERGRVPLPHEAPARTRQLQRLVRPLRAH
jgi:hypothetical protein